MSYVYVANTSIHHHVLTFSLEKGGKVFKQEIPIGGQVRLIDRKFTPEELEFLIKKQERYGLRNVKDLRGEKAYVGLCYSLDSPVPLNIFKGNLEHNAEVTDQQRDRRLERSSVAIADVLQERLDGAPTPLRRSTVEYTEETKGPDVPRISVGLEFAAEGVEPKNRGKQSKRL